MFVLMFVCNLLLPLIMVIAGYFMYKHSPKDINGIIGYRTKLSMKNQETWDFAQKFCGKLWLKIGGIMLLLSIILQIPFKESNENTICWLTVILETVQVIILIVSIVIAEKTLKNTFDKDGNRLKK